jgi:hypothetical protein
MNFGPVRKFIDGWEFEPHDPGLHEYADRAYTSCVGWFGPPPDEHWRYEIVRAPQRACAVKSWLHRRYVLYIPSEYKKIEQQCATVGHEMYHRVTMRRRGLRELAWVDELVAFLAAERLLGEQGMEGYALQRMKRRLAATPRLPVTELHKVTMRRRFRAGALSTVYPPGFYEGIWDVGSRLAGLVDWNCICNLVTCAGWHEWLRSVPPNVRPEVCHLMRFECESP